MLQDRRILLGVTGGIAAYKAAYLVRELASMGAEVRVVMTPAAQSFITPLTMQALSGNPVHTELMDHREEAGMGHINLARWADLVLVAPASADFLARLAHGLADDLLATLCLATAAPIAVAPAMNQQMWQNAATQDNVALLANRRVKIWGPAAGEQACGETGPGRMLEPADLAEAVRGFFSEGRLQGVKVLLTAGPTREPLDPVRFIGNRSSGKMGYALATAFRHMGAEVILVSGPVSLPAPSGVETVSVESAREMHDAVMQRVKDADMFVAAAAVADYRPVIVADQKIKKNEEILNIELTRNADILAQVGAMRDRPFTVGFAAETEKVEEYAESKRRSKGADMIAANRVAGEEGGFETDRNAITLLWEGGRANFPMMNKNELAEQLAAEIAEHYHAKKNRS